MSLFRIGCLQLELSTADNFDRISSEVRTAKTLYPKLDMVVFGELATRGFDPSTAEPLPGPTEGRYCDLARELGIWLIPGSLYERDGDNIYNTASVIDPSGQVIARYRKMFPWFPRESKTTPGDSFVVIDIPDQGRIGISICYDNSFPEVARGLAWLGAEAIINVTATYTFDRYVESALSQAHAFVNHCYVLDVCNTGKIGRGMTNVIGPDGDVIYRAGAVQEIIPVTIDFERARVARADGAFGLSPNLFNLARSKVKFPQFGNAVIAGSPAAFEK